MRFLGRWTLLAALLLGQVGCFWAVVGGAACGVAAYAYWHGKICHDYLADLPDALSATRQALQELGMPILKEEPGANRTILKARAGDGSKVVIRLSRATSVIPTEGNLTEICVRVGCFGDHPLSGRILYQISAHLVPVAPPGSPAPPPPPPPGAAAPYGPPSPPPPPGVTPAGWSAAQTNEPPVAR